MSDENITRRIESIKIEGLFELFDYDIVFPENENILIITGPNGFGKTQILNIVFNLFNRNFDFFQKLVFEKITIRFSSSIKIEITNIKNTIDLSVLNNCEVTNGMKYNNNNIKDYVTSSVVYDYEGNVKNSIKRILRASNAYLIRAQRLIKREEKAKYNVNHPESYTKIIDIIPRYRYKLINLLLGKSKDFLDLIQEIDESYLSRLFNEKNKISEEEYNNKLTTLQNKQNKLAQYGLYESTQNDLPYSSEDAKAILVYLNDLEQKLGLFDNLLEKLDLFTSILNERRFTFKSIQIDRDKGFYFQTDKGKELDLTDLSSGEQHEVVLLYELIFNTKPGDVVLIDEPEISLHITWQKKFLEDLLKIVKMQQIQVIVATHSPSIINDRWDLVYTLTKK